MTKEEIIEQLNLAIDLIKQDDKDWLDDRDIPMLEECVKALSKEPCEDAISREDVEECEELMTDINGDTVYAVRMSDIRQLPSVTQKSKTGKWIKEDTDWLFFKARDYRCSECGNTLDFDGVNVGRGDANFCPNCGAKMVEPQESEESE